VAQLQGVGCLQGGQRAGNDHAWSAFRMQLVRDEGLLAETDVQVLCLMTADSVASERPLDVVGVDTTFRWLGCTRGGAIRVARGQRESLTRVPGKSPIEVHPLAHRVTLQRRRRQPRLEAQWPTLQRNASQLLTLAQM
jgi:hypothetical protein